MSCYSLHKCYFIYWSCVVYLWIVVMFYLLFVHSDGTHSVQRIHWWASDGLLQFFKSDEEANSSTSLMAWGWVHFHFWVNYRLIIKVIFPFSLFLFDFEIWLRFCLYKVIQITMKLFFFGKNTYKWLKSWHMCSKLPLKRFWLAEDSLRLKNVCKSLHLSSSFILYNHGQFNNAKHHRSTTPVVHGTHAVFWSWWVCVRNRPKFILFLVARNVPLHQSSQIHSMFAVRLKYGTFGRHTML